MHQICVYAFMHTYVLRTWSIQITQASGSRVPLAAHESLYILYIDMYIFIHTCINAGGLSGQLGQVGLERNWQHIHGEEDTRRR